MTRKEERIKNSDGTYSRYYAVYAESESAYLDLESAGVSSGPGATLTFVRPWRERVSSFLRGAGMPTFAGWFYRETTHFLIYYMGDKNGE